MRSSQDSFSSSILRTAPMWPSIRARRAARSARVSFVRYADELLLSVLVAVVFEAILGLLLPVDHDAHPRVGDASHDRRSGVACPGAEGLGLGDGNAATPSHGRSGAV